MSQQEPETLHREMASDEIDLIQLIQVLIRRKYLIMIVFVLCVAVGAAYAILSPQKFEYTTTLQIGSMPEGDKRQLITSIEKTEISEIKIDKVYIPAAIAQIFKETGSKLTVQSKAQKNSNIILITSKGLFDEQNLYKDFHQRIVNPLIENHQKMIVVPRKQSELMVDKAILSLKTLEDPRIYMVAEKEMEGKIDQAKSKLIEYDDQKKLLEAQTHRLLETKKLLQEQIAKIEKTLAMAYANRPKASDEVTDEAKALTFLMVNNQIDQNENRLASLRERLFVQLENQKQQLENQLSENRRDWRLQNNKIVELQSELVKLRANRDEQINIQKNVIAEAENNLDFYQNTEALDLAVRSINPVGPKKALILVLAGILGLMAGIMLAFVAEFMVKVREKQVDSVS